MRNKFLLVTKGVMGGRSHSRYKEIHVMKEVKGSSMFVIYKVSIFEKAKEASRGKGVEDCVPCQGLMLLLREESSATMPPLFPLATVLSFISLSSSNHSQMLKKYVYSLY